MINYYLGYKNSIFLSHHQVKTSIANEHIEPNCILI